MSRPSVSKWFAAACVLSYCLAALPTRAQISDGLGDDGLAGYGPTGVFDGGDPSLALAATAGFGLIEEQPTTTGSSTRLMGRFGVGLRATDWFAASLYLDGRYDMHPDDGMGSDDSLVGNPEIRLRVGKALESGLLLGAELAVWVPGRDAPSIEFSATTLQLKTLLGYRLDALTLAVNFGFRLDNSANSIEHSDHLRPGDRVSLGLSEFNSIPVSLAVAYHNDGLEVFGGIHLALLLGDAPAFLNSPFGADLGLRYAMDEALGIEVRAEASFSSRPSQGPTDPLIRIDPRFSAFAGIRYAFGFAEERPSDEEVTVVLREPEIPQSGTLRGVLRTESGEPLSAAELVLAVGEVGRTATSDAEGRYEFTDVPLGVGTLTVRAEGYDQIVTKVKVEPGTNQQPDVELTESTPSGQLRGLVRSFAGAGVFARVTVTPGDISLTTEQDGTFEIDIAPGTYEVSIEAAGYVSQTRDVSIDENGVTVLNVDLRKRR